MYPSPLFGAIAWDWIDHGDGWRCWLLLGRSPASRLPSIWWATLGWGRGSMPQRRVHRSGSITKAGRSDLRTILVEAAWTSVCVSTWWRARFEQLTARMKASKAIVIIARKLLVGIWHVLSKRAADQHADPVAVARRLFRWGAAHHLARLRGMRRGTFVRSYLDQIGVGQELTHLYINGATLTLGPSG